MSPRIATFTSLLRRLALLRPLRVLLLLPLLVAACDTGLTEPVDLEGTWSGYLGMGENIDGQTLLMISEDRSCYLSAEISGTLQGWGSFTLRLEGEPLIYNRAVSGEITITRYRTGIDTVQTSGFWSGQFFLDTNSASGGWMTNTGGAFSAEGRWGASKR